MTKVQKNFFIMKVSRIIQGSRAKRRIDDIVKAYIYAISKVPDYEESPLHKLILPSESQNENWTWTINKDSLNI